MDMVIRLAAGEVGVGTQGRSLTARDGAAWVLRPWRLWLAILLQQRERGINTRLLPSSRLTHEPPGSEQISEPGDCSLRGSVPQSRIREEEVMDLRETSKTNVL